MDKLAESFDLAENTSRCVDVGDSQELVLLLSEGLLDFVQLRTVANGCLELSGLDTVCLEAISEAVGKVAGVEDEDIISGFGQVGSDLIPSEGTRARDDEGLRGGVLGLEQLAEHGQGLAERLDKGCAYVRLAGGCQSMLGMVPRRNPYL